MKPIFKVMIVLVVAAAVPLEAQVAPEATSGHSIPINGNVSWAVRYSQTEASYPGGNGGQVAVLSGDFNYVTNNERTPFSIVFGAGDNWVLTGTPYDSGPFENFTISQGLAGEHWSIQLSDNLSYRKGAPVDGFAGEPGTGEPIGGTSPPTDETVVTLNESVVNNMANADYEYKLNGFSSLSVGGGYSILRYLNGESIDIDSEIANMGWTQKFSVRNTVVGQYAFDHFSYPGTTNSFNLNTPTVQWMHSWSRAITSKVSAGPQFLSSSESTESGSTETGDTPVTVPAHTSVGVSVSASIADNTPIGGANVDYSHGVEGGGGYLYGGTMDSVTAGLNHQFGRQITSQLSLEFTGGYRHQSSLIAPSATGEGTGTGIGAFAGNIGSEFGAVQANRALGRIFSVNASFTCTEQSYQTQINTPANADALNGLWRVISVGVGYTPQPIHLRH